MYALSADLVQAYCSLFVHCWDTYAVQHLDGSYARSRARLSPALIIGHLQGRFTLGAYLLDALDTCISAIFDDDRSDGLLYVNALAAELEAQGVWSLPEASRRGAHLRVFLAEPTPAAWVRAWLLPYAQAWGMELYPKQDRLSTGPGSLVRLPLGIHRQTGGWYPFLLRTSDGDLLPVGETVADCCAWVAAHIQRVRVPESMTVQERCEGSFPTLASPVSARSGVHHIHEWCQSQDIMAVIGRYVALDQRGMGSCPFKGHHYRGDVRPSFQVFGGSDPHWYCYTWGRAGDLFDFFCEYYGLTPQEAWIWLQEGRFG
ncbi:MAG: hypothetical protein J2P37_35595 [Ktedonobacteraceae bacterium]|nr:hypothetical protein [Ktedonobacteraceae bacterium]